MKLNLSLHKRGLSGQSHIKIYKSKENYCIFNPTDLKRIKNELFELYPDTLKKVVKENLEVRR